MAGRLNSMLPRQIPIQSLWRAPPTFLAPCLRSPFSTTPAQAQTLRRVKKAKKRERRDNRDSYTLRQVEARRQANLSRQSVLQAERKKAMGDPIRGIETPFVKSFDTAIPQDPARSTTTPQISVEAVARDPASPPPSPAHASHEDHLDHSLTHSELSSALQYSADLTSPVADTLNPGVYNDAQHADSLAKEKKQWAERNATAAEAVNRLVSLANASSKNRTKKNVERIVGTFGRHNTDTHLPPRGAAAGVQPLHDDVEKHDGGGVTATPRAGPDTGSSEVQIAVLTAKIRVLADAYEGAQRNDKVNKRNLRLLLHRRQKLLKYLQRKERGGPRWQHLIETLGLTEATWAGQIEVQ